MARRSVGLRWPGGAEEVAGPGRSFNAMVESLDRLAASTPPAATRDQ